MLLQLCSLNAFSQVRELSDSSIVDVKEFTQQDSNLLVDFVLDLECVDLQSKQKVVYTPRLVSPDNSISLPAIILEGRNSYKSSIRRDVLMNKKERLAADVALQPYARLKSFGDSVKVVNYSYSIPYQSWMANAILTLDSDIECRCGDACGHETSVLVNLAKLELAPVFEVLPVMPNSEVINYSISKITSSNSFVLPISSYEDDLKNLVTHKDNDALKLYFELSQSDFDENFMTNKAVMSNFITVAKELNSIEGLSISKILVAGFASVEGTLAVNEQLAYNRARSIKNYLESRTDIDSVNIEVYNGGENWVGLRDMVASSDMTYREEVLEIIDNTPVRIYVGRKLVDGRNHQLMLLKGGDPYRYMMKHIFPRLRQAGYVRVYFDLKNDSPDPIIH